MKILTSGPSQVNKLKISSLVSPTRWLKTLDKAARGRDWQSRFILISSFALRMHRFYPTRNGLRWFSIGWHWIAATKIRLSNVRFSIQQRIAYDNHGKGWVPTNIKNSTYWNLMQKCQLDACRLRRPVPYYIKLGFAVHDITMGTR